ncbi:MAG TPA: Clp protease N-terminal domain-containing protein [Acidimicrobiales bacterium]|nr:Clp protease N-terminal domain-containing protein [Acidimicrobiales bacterium]
MSKEPVVPETHHAWAIYLQASEEARRRGDRRTGTDHILLALLEDPSIELPLGVNLQQARQALESLDLQALGALGFGPGTDAPELPMRAVPKKPRLRDIVQKDRPRPTPAAKKVLQDAVKPNRRKSRVTAQQVLAQILTLGPPDPATALLGALGVNKSEVRGQLDLTERSGAEDPR